MVVPLVSFFLPCRLLFLLVIPYRDFLLSFSYICLEVCMNYIGFLSIKL